METLSALGLVATVKRRFVELREPPTEWRFSQALYRRRLARAAEMLEMLSGVDGLPGASEVVNCIERIESAEVTAGQHARDRRELSHEWVASFVKAAPQLFPGDVADMADMAVADTLDAIGNLRKPGTIAAACVMLALQGTTVDQLRAGQGRDRNLYHMFV
jgi:hypothetical protein